MVRDCIAAQPLQYVTWSWGAFTGAALTIHNPSSSPLSHLLLRSWLEAERAQEGTNAGVRKQQSEEGEAGVPSDLGLCQPEGWAGWVREACILLGVLLAAPVALGLPVGSIRASRSLSRWPPRARGQSTLVKAIGRTTGSWHPCVSLDNARLSTN